MYFIFFIGVMCVLGLVFIVYASFYKEQDFVRTEDSPPAEPPAAAAA